MIDLSRDHVNCKVFVDEIDEVSMSQIMQFTEHPAFRGMKMRFMPDVHAGAGAVIGTTVELGKKIIPNVIGVDIGCGVTAWNLGDVEIDFIELDNTIREKVPYGFKRHSSPIVDRQASQPEAFKHIAKGTTESWFMWQFVLENVAKATGQISENVWASLGSLGGGNHFIEVAQGSGAKYLLVHSGSRNFGLQVAKYHQKVAKETCSDDVPKGMAYLEGVHAMQYITDMKVAQEYAQLNRRLIGELIFSGMGWEAGEVIESVHNYIDFDQKIIRKGAISAKKDESLVIPLNMRDGTLIGVGKGNYDWNHSAPHGAGRRLSRSAAKAELSVEDFKATMEEAGVWSSCVSSSTLDEAPDAYKDAQTIMQSVKDTMTITDHLKPLYNFKAS